MMATQIFSHYHIGIGLSASGFAEHKSEVLPEYNHGMIFIAEMDGCHAAYSLRCVDGVKVTPVYSEFSAPTNKKDED